MHVLLSAYACHPVEGSEPAVGWHLLLGALATGARVTLLTRANNEREVREALSSAQLAQCTIVAFDLHPVFQRAKKRVPGGTQTYYWAWQIAARRLVRELHSDTPFDVAHHATFAVDWAPTAISSLPAAVTKVWGPVGGATLCPRPLLRELGLRGLCTEVVRVAIGSIGRATNGRVNARRSALVITQNADDARVFRRIARRMEIEPNVFLDSSTLPPRRCESVDEHLIVGVGRLIPLKGWTIALRVLRRLPDEFHLRIFGEGPDLSRLEHVAKKIGVEGRVQFMGHRQRFETFDAVARARCVLFPSLHDAAGAAVAEAVAIGTPVVCLGVGGPPQILRETGSGAVVSPYVPDVIGALAAAVADIEHESPSTRWDSARAVQLVTRWYREALGGGDPGGNHRRVPRTHVARLP